MAKPFAHLEGIWMKLDWGISPPRGVAGKAWSQPWHLPPAPQRRETVHSASPGGCGQNGIGLHDASGTLGTCQSCFATVAASRIPRPCCRTLPRTLLHEALVWVPDTCRDGPNSTSQPQRCQGPEADAEAANQDRCLQDWLQRGASQADAGCWPMDRDQPGEAFRRDEDNNSKHFSTHFS
uniref:Uncharacterized protein n=1 Tax=Myotis myotis TaxID=51298 RepID=A0A7J7ZWX5_MYOMY|nr:hypothetical protein mMyoMyo1_009602 [Myotis myotis]